MSSIVMPCPRRNVRCSVAVQCRALRRGIRDKTAARPCPRCMLRLCSPRACNKCPLLSLWLPCPRLVIFPQQQPASGFRRLLVTGVRFAGRLLCGGYESSATREEGGGACALVVRFYWRTV